MDTHTHARSWYSRQPRTLSSTITAVCNGSQRTPPLETKIRSREEQRRAPLLTPTAPASSCQPVHFRQHSQATVTTGFTKAECPGPSPPPPMPCRCGGTPSPAKHPVKTKRCQPHAKAMGTSPCARLRRLFWGLERDAVKPLLPSWRSRSPVRYVLGEGGSSWCRQVPRVE